MNLREIRVAAVIALAGGLVAAAVAAVVHIGHDLWVLREFGFPLSRLTPLLADELRANALLLPIFVLVFWSLSSWRLPWFVTALGLVLLAAASQLVLIQFFHGIDGATEGVAVLGVGMNIALRISGGLHRKYKSSDLQAEIKQ